MICEKQEGLTNKNRSIIRTRFFGCGGNVPVAFLFKCVWI
jgi:hypothetical protein